MTRLNPFITHAALIQPLIDLGTGIQADLDPGLSFLVRIRASQLNGCTSSLFNNVRLARENGESEERLGVLAAWRRSPLFSARERAALAWAEALTLVSAASVPDDVYEAFAAEFSEEEQVRLTLMIAVINGFNRLGVGFAVGHPPAAAVKAA